MKAIEADRLTVRYQGTPVLQDISFELETGHYLAIVGPNGSGKSTLVKAMLGLVPMAGGTVRIGGTPIEQFHDWGRIGYMPQIANRVANGFPANVRDVVISGCLSRKRFPRRFTRADRDRVNEVLELLRIGDLAGRLIGRLSGGQQQRVMLARALVADPDILILDEPSVALDPTTRERFYGILAELNRGRGKTIVLITHDSGTVGQYADRLLYLDRRLIFNGNFQEFCESPAMTGYFGEAAQHLICHRHDDACNHDHPPTDTPP